MSERKSNIPQWMWEEYDLHNHPDLVAILETRFMPWDEMVRTYAPDLALPAVDIDLWEPPAWLQSEGEPPRDYTRPAWVQTAPIYGHGWRFWRKGTQ